MPDGATLRQHLVAAAQSGVDVPELEPVPVPLGCSGILDVFWHLRRQAGNGFGASAITFESLVAWQRLYGVQLSPWEIDTIITLDSVALIEMAAQNVNNSR
jgi:hypothetical protein